VKQASLELEVRKDCQVQLAALEIQGRLDQMDPEAVLERLGRLAAPATRARRVLQVTIASLINHGHKNI